MKRIAIAAAAAAILSVGVAHAQPAPSPLYGELGYSFMDIRDFAADANPQALRGIIGYNLHPYFALEGMLGFGVNDDTDKGLNVKLNHEFGVYVKPKYDWNNLQLFARLGYSHVQLKAHQGAYSATEHEDGFSYGVGANYNFNPRMYVGLDWMHYTDKDHVRVRGTTVSFGYRF